MFMIKGQKKRNKCIPAKLIVMLTIVLLSTLFFLTGCGVEKKYCRTDKLGDVMLTNSKYSFEIESLTQGIPFHINEFAKLVAEGVFKETNSEEKTEEHLVEQAENEQSEDIVPEVAGVEWFELEEGDDDSMFRIDGQKPFYEYADLETGNLLLTLYYDEQTKEGKGIYYCSGFDQERTDCVGFIVRNFEDAKEPYRKPEMFTYNGAPIEEHALKDIQEYAEYDENGNVTLFYYEGKSGEEYYKEEAESNALIKCEIQYSYREDGTLWKKKGSCDSMEYGYISGYKTCYFDKIGREVYSYEYITHGALGEFYIYENDSTQPTYCFVFDPGWNAYMMKY